MLFPFQLTSSSATHLRTFHLTKFRAKRPIMATMKDATLIDETEKRLRSHKGVAGFLVITAEGIAIRSTLDKDLTVKYSALVSRYIQKARSCTKALCEDDELQMVRIRSAKHEVIIAPDFCTDTGYCLVIVQDATQL